MMSAIQVRQALAGLGLTQQEAATLLGVSPRSVRRWLEGEAIAGPAEAALRAWQQLEARGLAWRPDSVTLFEENQQRIAVYRQEAMHLDALLERVAARGGPRLPWKVDLSECHATMEWASLSFYKLQHGGFSPSVYRRSDQQSPPDVERDRELIEDALYCIAAAFQKSERRARALRAVADHARKHSNMFVTSGPRMLEDAERRQRQYSIEAVAERLDLLASQTLAGDKTNYQQFEKLRGALAGFGFATDRTQVSEVARSFFDGQPKVRVIFMRPGRLDNAIAWTKEFDPDVAARMIAGHRLHPIGERLRPINESAHELATPQFVVLHIPIGVEFVGVDHSGYFVVADLRPSQVNLGQSPSSSN
jgi:transcriptional regulator with XRE-family HTH domain